MTLVAESEVAGPRIIATGFDDWDFPRATTGVVLLVDFAAEHGMSAADCLAGSGIEVATLRDPDLLVEASQEIAVVRNLLRRFGDRPSLGVELGARYHLTTFGIFGYALISSPTMRDVFQVGLRYSSLSFAFSQMTAEVDEFGRFVLRMRGDRIPADVRRCLVERDCAANVVLHRQMFAGSEPIPLQQVDIAFPEIPRAPHAALFGVPVTYDTRSTALYLDGGYVDRALPHGNPHTAEICLELCERILAKRTTGGVAREVRDQLIENGGVDQGIEHVARGMHMTSRTLRRKLVAEGTNYRRLLDEVRLTIVQDTLRGEKLSAAELAHRLGYSEPSSFIRAFRRWTAEEPR